MPPLMVWKQISVILFVHLGSSWEPGNADLQTQRKGSWLSGAGGGGGGLTADGDRASFGVMEGSGIR